MIKKWADSLSEIIVNAGGDANSITIYSYAFEGIFNFLIADLFLYTYAIFVHKFPEVFIWSIAYTILRTFMGGYHASSHLRCIIMSILLGIMSIYCSMFWNQLSLFIGVALFAAVLITFICPIKHTQHPMNKKQRLQNKGTAFIILIILSILMFALNTNANDLSRAICTGIFFSSIFALLGFIKNLFHN